MSIILRLLGDVATGVRDRVERITRPFNTKAVSVVGYGWLTVAGSRLYHNVTDVHFVRSLYQAVVLHADPGPLYELAAIAAGALLGALCLQLGYPVWFTRPDPPPAPPEPPADTAQLQAAA